MKAVVNREESLKGKKKKEKKENRCFQVFYVSCLWVRLVPLDCKIGSVVNSTFLRGPKWYF